MQRVWWNISLFRRLYEIIKILSIVCFQRTSLVLEFRQRTAVKERKRKREVAVARGSDAEEETRWEANGKQQRDEATRTYEITIVACSVHSMKFKEEVAQS